MTYHYIVTFMNNKKVWVDITDNNINEARTLATAVMGHCGYNTDIKSVIKTTNLSDIADVDFVA